MDMVDDTCTLHSFLCTPSHKYITLGFFQRQKEKKSRSRTRASITSTVHIVPEPQFVI